MQVRTIQVLAVFALSTAIAGLSQTASTPNGAAGQPKRPPPAPMLPFTAEFKTTVVQILASGATISTESTRTQARDGEGRYYDANTSMPRDGRPQITSFHISDPIAGTETRWDSQRKKATVYQLPPEDQRHGCWQTESGNAKWSYPLTPEQRTAEKFPETSPPVMPTASDHAVHQNLGTDVIQGLQVHGSRTTITTPAGQAGNDQPLVRTSEAWYSDEYRIQARWINDDPQQGKTTRELVGFTPGEPDPSLFQPPQGYEVVNEELHPVPCHQ
jgi:hypothetical protein